MNTETMEAEIASEFHPDWLQSVQDYLLSDADFPICDAEVLDNDNDGGVSSQMIEELMRGGDDGGVEAVQRREAAAVGEVRGGDTESGEEGVEVVAGDVRDAGGGRLGLRQSRVQAAWVSSSGQLPSPDRVGCF
ncbi:ethylene-responsive transcription factor 1-like [Salvia divinorum]|uniref:Ethylene-responsive transcription factor 1-like n=1 Tax=Salvia divinorum TaxID=28513 RepID=A0ABD1GGS8_SALDI